MVIYIYIYMYVCVYICIVLSQERIGISLLAREGTLPLALSKMLLADLVAKIDSVPANYVRPITDRPNLQEVETVGDASIPVIDLQGLHGPNRPQVIQQIGQACEEYGFFQVIFP